MAGVLACASLFTGCSDDDDDKGSDVPGSGDVAVLERKVAKITEKFQSEVTDVTTFAYDASGRLVKMTTSGDNARVIDVTYPEGQIVMSYSYEDDADAYRVTMTLENGRAVSNVSGSTSEEATTWSEVKYSYSGNFLSRTEWVYMNEDNETDPTDEDVTNWEVTDGKLTRMYGTYEDGEDETLFTQSDVANNANIDLFAYLLLSDYEDVEPFYFGAGGNRFEMMPSKMTSQDVDGVYDELTITYETDAAGYVTRITASRDDDGYQETSTYEITYE